ncbi:hypothetical protein B0H21DRAFT_822615 [Amylocystis lapponica]|nr:hypothetical protein B0H21DRAFT_822615 [Amylocystis lapponica]
MAPIESTTSELKYPHFFSELPNRQLWRCNICPGQPWSKHWVAVRHEGSQRHTYEIRRLDSIDVHQPAPNDLLLSGAESQLPRDTRYDPDDVSAIISARTLSHFPVADDVLGPVPSAPSVDSAPSLAEETLPDDDPMQIYNDWGGLLGPTRPECPTAELPLDGTVGMDSDVEAVLPPPAAPQGNVKGPDLTTLHDPSKLSENTRHAPEYIKQLFGEQDWWPWLDKESCLMDIMGAFPRALFSESKLEATKWFAERAAGHQAAGLKPTTHEGQLGNLYTTCNLQRIIEDEFSNPLGARWLHEVDANLAGPMARGADGKDYYVDEIALANLDDMGRVGPVMVRRWFRRGGELVARVNPLLVHHDGRHFLVDERKKSTLVVPLSAFLLSVEDLDSPQIQAHYNLPSPSAVEEALISDDPRILLAKWKKPSHNPWRDRAAGKQVLALPMWLYCDDTSGNSSKKWNKHNSILLMLAGLPRHLAQLLYNIHFICTSNLAAPLEMMEDLSVKLWETGIEVWDSLTQEKILVITWVLAFLGDNPMASEFESHIGMSGKCFCRICKVKGADEKNRDAGAAGARARLKEFMMAGEPRTKADTLHDLDAQLQRALQGAPSALDEMARESGSKDKYFEHFVAQLRQEANHVRDTLKGKAVPEGSTRAEQVKAALCEFWDAMIPESVVNPTLSILDFDLNQDSLFEVLHVILLGVLKYFWRDAVSRQSEEGKNKLKTRLSSFDVSGLGIAPLRGHTLVQYAGSLVGRDFRTVLQAAPAVLQGMVPDECYEAWLALCRLAPLMFQPVIKNLSEYSVALEHAITNFMAATTLWTTQWFNKPKFHLFLHLLGHIRRFGPAALYSTEGFESYNLVIRLRSIHSNRHAPSDDIAENFSFCMQFIIS